MASAGRFLLGYTSFTNNVLNRGKQQLGCGVMPLLIVCSLINCGISHPVGATVSSLSSYYGWGLLISGYSVCFLRFYLISQRAQCQVVIQTVFVDSSQMTVVSSILVFFTAAPTAKFLNHDGAEQGN